MKCFVCGQNKDIDELGALCVVNEDECSAGILCTDCSVTMNHDMWSCFDEWDGKWSNGKFEPVIKASELPKGCVHQDFTELFHKDDVEAWRLDLLTNISKGVWDGKEERD